ncbi:hypothetical protein ACFU93_38405 [Streptomyces sp. NPDC057611]|uniref:hypothetical protein n=1 Tax=Streptomyces sp. NPDC057611 TaxID=3346182 RepID=UPI00369530EF
MTKSQQIDHEAGTVHHAVLVWTRARHEVIGATTGASGRDMVQVAPNTACTISSVAGAVFERCGAGTAAADRGVRVVNAGGLCPDDLDLPRAVGVDVDNLHVVQD